MRKEKILIGDFAHVLNRGNRKQEIVRDDIDRFAFVRMLFYFNDEYSINISLDAIKKMLGGSFGSILSRPSNWPPADPLVKIHAVILKDNHYHILLEEIKENGIARFMHRLGVGMACRFNKRYDEVGSLFQGSYKFFKVKEGFYLEYLNVYIHFKNALEAYPGGIKNALENFDDAYEFAVNYQFSSLAVYEKGEKHSPFGKIISTDALAKFFNKKDESRERIKEILMAIVEEMEEKKTKEEKR